MGGALRPTSGGFTNDVAPEMVGEAIGGNISIVQF